MPNSDITRCVTHNCPLRDKCARYINIASERPRSTISMATFMPNDDGKVAIETECEHHILKGDDHA